MDPTTPRRRRLRRLLALVASATLVGTLLTGTATAADTELAVNGGFESGLSGWTCSGSTGQATASPVRTGSGALRAAPAGADNARCAQPVTVRPSSTYTLSAWVQGAYVYLGASGATAQDVSTWTPSASTSTWQRLSLTFTTSATATSATIYLHGWYGQPAYVVDDVSLVGPGGGTTQPPATPTGLTAGTPTASSVPLTWGAVTGATGYAVYRDDTKVATTTTPSATVTGLTAATAYSFQVTATSSAGESARSTAVTVTTADGGGTGGDLPPHALVGYLHASFANGSGYTRMADVPDSWDVINLAFGEPTSVTSGDIRFSLCPQTECPNVEPVAEFKAAIAAKRAEGKKVLLSIGGQNGQVQLTTTAARDAFVTSVSSIIDTYGLDGVDIDFEGHSLYLNTGDTDFRNPTTPVIVNLISALKTLAARYGDDFVLTMAPETFFVQNGYQFYGSGPWGGQDPRCGAYLPVIHALRDDLTLLHVQDYNSGPIMGLDDQYHTMGGADFHIAMTDMLLTGFPVARDTTKEFPALRPDQVAIGLPASTHAGNGHTAPAQVNQALDCLTKGTGCGSYQTHGRWPGLRGLMTWSINWDRYNVWEFSRNFDAYWP